MILLVQTQAQAAWSKANQLQKRHKPRTKCRQGRHTREAIICNCVETTQTITTLPVRCSECTNYVGANISGLDDWCNVRRGGCACKGAVAPCCAQRRERKENVVITRRRHHHHRGGKKKFCSVCGVHLIFFQQGDKVVCGLVKDDLGST